ncbi:nitroreductase [Pseudomonadales bacterium]|jgi:nitroreductase|uniref:Nitroreductase n=1 Tax=SAR86 cluster bacterium TaxID=2030880 RepID=A0A972W0D2_9GAMM|nr:nitroreductase [Pseudomonadales bacterium]MDB9867557.1 nitroreductase [Pseudomonadales bacterium]MDB9917698.1 nitroreductase [Pseudomonadales bacterium]MDC0174255.1 nitroreductase [Pseudomonadales bacterium]NQV65650.1 nitroreductase [SAR86 cluster bacterium]|tara:strand:+ start:7195 stop:7848 length:654 start_codon:yes stop_codon:yes gene_type:complete
MRVSEAVNQRRSIRAFLDKPVESQILEELLIKAARAPSGGNVQPWRVYVVNGPAMARFRDFRDSRKAPEAAAYEIYPQGLTEPYRSSRFKVGEDMYSLLGIPREDRGARIRRLMENYNFFGAPAAIFCFVDKQMGPPQWSDLGMFLQTFMLLATEAGLDTCAQEAWAARPDTVAEFVGAPPEQMLFCGVAIGFQDPAAPVNSLVSEREPLNGFATFL